MDASILTNFLVMAQAAPSPLVLGFIQLDPQLCLTAVRTAVGLQWPSWTKPFQFSFQALPVTAVQVRALFAQDVVVSISVFSPLVAIRDLL